MPNGLAEQLFAQPVPVINHTIARVASANGGVGTPTACAV
jgi:hypothetical protein